MQFYKLLLAIADRSLLELSVDGRRNRYRGKVGKWLNMHAVIIVIEENVKNDLSSVWQARTTKYKRFLPSNCDIEKSLDSADEAYALSKMGDFPW